MESTLEIARQAVDADMARDFATAFKLYTQAAQELEHFAANAGSSRTPDEVTGASRTGTVGRVGAGVAALAARWRWLPPLCFCL